MKILVVTQSFIPHQGGQSTHIEDLIHGLRINNFDVSLLSGQLFVLPVTVRGILFLRSLGSKSAYRYFVIRKTSERMINAIRREISRGIQIIHCHDPISCHAARRACEKERKSIKIVETVHGPWASEILMTIGSKFADSKYLAKISCLEGEAANIADAIIAVDTGQKCDLINGYGINPEKIRIIYNSVNIDAIDQQPNSICRYPSEKPYVIVPRRLVRKNGVDVAIKAMQYLVDEGLEMWIVGSGPLMNELKYLAKSLGLDNVIRFLGGMDRADLFPIMRKAKAVIIPSIPNCGVIEASSLSALEGMALGRIVIATNIGGLAEIIKDKETGILFSPGDSMMLAQTIQYVLANNNEISEIESRAKNEIQNKYDSKAWIQGIIEVYAK